MSAKKEDLLVVNARVVHFGKVRNGHGLGTIVEMNGVRPNGYLEEKPAEAVKLAGQLGVIGALVNSMYDGCRFPYVVQWDNGYKDVYEVDSLELYDPNNPDHQVKEVA